MGRPSTSGSLPARTDEPETPNLEHEAKWGIISVSRRFVFFPSIRRGFHMFASVSAAQASYGTSGLAAKVKSTRSVGAT